MQVDNTSTHQSQLQEISQMQANESQSIQTRADRNNLQTQSTRQLEKRIKILEEELLTLQQHFNTKICEKDIIITNQQIELEKIQQLVGIVQCENCILLQSKIQSQLLLINEFQSKFPSIIQFMKKMDCSVFEINVEEQYQQSQVYNQLQQQIQTLKSEIVALNEDKFLQTQQLQKLIQSNDNLQNEIDNFNCQDHELSQKLMESEIQLNKVQELQQLVEKYELEAHEWKLKYELMLKK
ncbi:hypothetical protein SS50377_24417 [Spironucleus salmonicida]|uniref:Uncharacterized protein n=1 Tax=Spironucleus salmonicida TaxID=348837 RepID=V6LP67_9EUKA|nr:hypothetical protein SS50377_24417 [Spironucleus salmonicida]|eukprot:EST46033.1 Hypothetical protein SS50377_14021 [Spironucleus salmonicida]